MCTEYLLLICWLFVFFMVNFKNKVSIFNKANILIFLLWIAHFMFYLGNSYLTKRDRFSCKFEFDVYSKTLSCFCDGQEYLISKYHCLNSNLVLRILVLPDVSLFSEFTLWTAAFFLDDRWIRSDSHEMESVTSWDSCDCRVYFDCEV